VKLWNRDGRELTTLQEHDGAIREVAISPDDTFLASGGDDNMLILWNLPNILNLNAENYSCKLIKDYLRTNPQLSTREHVLCER
jgi:WD40 repeat protein